MKRIFTTQTCTPLICTPQFKLTMRVALMMVCLLGGVSRGWSAPPAKAIVPAEHSHPDHGPHGGSLLELGDEEYHVEALLDEKTNTLTLYLLDSAAKELVSTDSQEAILNIKQKGKPVQYKLPAATTNTDTPGSASSFVLKSQALVQALHETGHNARLVIKVNGKSFGTKFQFEHDHDHDHKH